MTTQFKIKASELKVCIFCDTRAILDYIGETVIQVCPECGDYKGLMTVDQWEDSTGEVWDNE